MADNNAVSHGGNGKNIKRAAKQPAKTVQKRSSSYKSSSGKAPQTQGQSRRRNTAAAPKKRTPSKRRVNSKLSNLKVIPLGGLDEIGKNMTLLEYENDIVIIDCGMTFPDADMLGVDIVIPDFTYLKENASKVRAVVLTHGHEDHIGSLPYLLKDVNVPVYGTGLTVGLVSAKLKEHGMEHLCSINRIEPGDVIKFGAFSVEFIHTNHSIPDAVALAVRTPVGIVFHTGDFKIDATPIHSEMIDLARIAEIAKEGVLLMMSDSTNATRPGFTMSESRVGYSFENLFKKAGNKRILIATFSSNIHRIQQIVDCAIRYNRKVAVVGRSMQNIVQIAMELNYLTVPDGIMINIGNIRNYADENLVIITTGSQGEPMSALHRMAFSDHRKVEITPNDFIIISASPIPGNEKMVTNVINELLKLGAEVIFEKMYEVHVSGHACQEELKMMLSLVKPKYFIPVHGEQMHMRAHAELAYSVGMDKSNVLVSEIGKVIEVNRDSIKETGTVHSGSIMVDGLGVGDIGSIVLNDRRHLAEDGLIIAVMTIEKGTGEVLAGPSLVSRGFVYVRESEQLMEEARKRAEDALFESLDRGVRDWNVLKTHVRDALSRVVYERTKRSPMILPIIMEV